MADHYGFSETECKIIRSQIERRKKWREEFLKLRTDPKMHECMAGYVFDPAVQRFLSMKTCQFDYFKACKRSAIKGVVLLIPMILYGYIVHKQRTQFAKDVRCGKIKYRDRLFKLI